MSATIAINDTVTVNGHKPKWQVRAIVDEEQLVIRRWRGPHWGWQYKIETEKFLTPVPKKRRL